jgi:ribosomal protein S18 acetylase RimI-like enzyme
MGEWNFRTAVGKDKPALLALINSAYRGEVSMQGWTTEAHLIAGEQRTDLPSLKEVFELPGSYFRVAGDAYGILVACVNLQQRGEDLYLGMLSVKPDLQNHGLGKMMLQEAEMMATELGCQRVIMTVISVRTELIDWYKRHGYVDTGVRLPFAEDGVSGKHLQPMEFMELARPVGNRQG